MQPPPRLPRNPLDLAFWGLIVAICVVMGGGIYAMGVRTRTSRTTAATAQDPQRQVPPSTPEGPVQFEGNIDPDPSSGPRRNSEPTINRVSQSSRELAGIEQRLEEIASNLGELRQTVNRPVQSPGHNLEPTVEFVREFRHLLETGQRTLTQPLHDSERRRNTPVLNRTAAPSAIPHIPAEELDTPRAQLGEEEPAPVTALANPVTSRSNSGQFDAADLPGEDEPSDANNSDATTSALSGIDTSEDEPGDEVSTLPVLDESRAEKSTSDASDADTASSGSRDSEDVSIPDETDDTSSGDQSPDPDLKSESATEPPEADASNRDMTDLEASDPVSGIAGPSTVPSTLPPPASDDDGQTSDDRRFDPAQQSSRPSEEAAVQTMVQLFYPRNRQAEQLVREVEKLLTPGLGKVSATNQLAAKKTGGIGPAQRTPRQAIAVKDTPEALQRIAEFLERVDKPGRTESDSALQAEITVDVTAVGVRLPGSQRQGVDLQELSSAGGAYTLWAHPTDRILKCAAGLPNDRDGRLKLAILTGEESPLLRELRSQGSLQAVARSRVTMRSTEASRLVVEQETGSGRRDPQRDHSIGVRPVVDSNGSIRLQILPGTDEQGRPVEDSLMPVDTLGEVELRSGETAVIAGILQRQPANSRSRTNNTRYATRSEADLVEWIYLVTPRSNPVSARSRQSTNSRNSTPIAQRLREHRQTAAR